MGISVTIKNKLPDLIEQFAEFADKQCAAAALAIETDAKKRAPVDTGRLRASGHTTRNGDADYSVIFSTNYALYVHEGARKRPGRPFLREAVAAYQPRLIASFAGLEDLAR